MMLPSPPIPPQLSLLYRTARQRLAPRPAVVMFPLGLALGSGCGALALLGLGNWAAWCYVWACWALCCRWCVALSQSRDLRRYHHRRTGHSRLWSLRHHRHHRSR
jgi:hypothetical protein